MNKRKKWLVCLLATLALSGWSQVSELNAKLSINSSKVQGTNKEVFNTLQRALNEFINNKKWTNAKFSPNERIDCTFTMIVNTQEDNRFSCELQVQARRPVYNSSYMTTIFNFRDTQLDFQYMENEPLEFSETTLQSNLTATIVFYIYMILGIDFDGFSPKGGSVFFQQAQQILTLAQSEPSWNGWKAFENDRNRHALITALTENQSEGYRQFWYDYHRKGLDEMAANADRGRTNILEALPALTAYKCARPTSILLQVFSDTKLDELVAIYSKATTQEKQAGYKILSNLYPGQTNRLESLRN